MIVILMKSVDTVELRKMSLLKIYLFEMLRERKTKTKD